MHGNYEIANSGKHYMNKRKFNQKRGREEEKKILKNFKKEKHSGFVCLSPLTLIPSSKPHVCLCLCLLCFFARLLEKKKSNLRGAPCSPFSDPDSGKSDNGFGFLDLSPCRCETSVQSPAPSPSPSSWFLSAGFVLKSSPFFCNFLRGWNALFGSDFFTYFDFKFLGIGFGWFIEMGTFQIGWTLMILRWRMRSDPTSHVRIATKILTSPPFVTILKMSTLLSLELRYFFLSSFWFPFTLSTCGICGVIDFASVNDPMFEYYLKLWTFPRFYIGWTWLEGLLF